MTWKSFSFSVGINIFVLLVFFGMVLGIYEIYLRYKLNLSDSIKPVLDQPIFEKDADLGWIHKKNIEFNYVDGKSFINPLGHRDQYFSNAARRILMLGDSFTFGMNVAQNHTMTAYLQGGLNSLEWDVMNAGVIGYTIGQELIYLRKYFDEIKPSAVILNAFVANDITEQRRNFLERDKKGYPISINDQEVTVIEPGILASKKTIPFWGSLALADIFTRSKALIPQKNKNAGYTWAVFLDKEHPSYPSDIDALWQDYESDLLKMKNYLNEKNVPFLVVIIPMDVQVHNKYWSKYPNKVFEENEFKNDRPQKKFQNICKQNELNCLDLLPIFREHSDELLFPAQTDSHFNEAGNRLAAESIFAKLKPILCPDSKQFNICSVF